MNHYPLNHDQIKKNAAHCRERGILIPTFAQMREPDAIPMAIKTALKEIGLWDVHPANLFRITWKNEPATTGGGFGEVNHMVLPSELTGVKAKIVAICGKWFPTGAHKVGATFGCLVPELVSGHFDPAATHAVWPSTGNYCRGGAYVSALLGCQSIAILPENMSRERFEWLAGVAGEVIATHGCESNVKEIFDKCKELETTRGDINIFNQFKEKGNMLWHYSVTGHALEEVIRRHFGGAKLAGSVFSSGSAGTLGAGYYLKQHFPGSKLAVSEALQCPTLLMNGFGDHRIEGIGDKHIPLIHDVKSTDMVMAIDDAHTLRILRLFNEPVGRKVLKSYGVPEEIVAQLDLMGISCIANMLSAIKFAKYYELTANDVVATVFTDSADLYRSRLEELSEQHGEYTEIEAHKDMALLQGLAYDHVQELTYYDRKRIHNLKYFTWVEQQNIDANVLNAQWYEHDSWWGDALCRDHEVDELIMAFNEEIGFK